MNDLIWINDTAEVNWQALSKLYLIAPLGEKHPNDLSIVFNNSLFKYFIYQGKQLVGAGRALADGLDCSYICDVVVHPDMQGQGLGKAIMQRLIEVSAQHNKIILYAKPGKEGFYQQLGFKRMKTAMVIFKDAEGAADIGLTE